MQIKYDQTVADQKEQTISRQEIIQLSQKIKTCIAILQKHDKIKEKNAHNRLISSYESVLSKTAHQLKTSKERYQNIDKVALVDKRCKQLEEQILSFQKESLLLSNQIRKTILAITTIKRNNNFLAQNVEYLNKKTKMHEVYRQNQKQSYLQLQQAFLQEQEAKKDRNSNQKYPFAVNLISPQKINKASTNRTISRIKKSKPIYTDFHFSTVNFEKSTKNY